MRHKLHESTWGDEEIAAASEVLRSGSVTAGERVAQFEVRFGPNAVFVNSGSSANLLAIAAICNPLLDDHLEPGDEVIVPALCWSTTVWPIIQHGLIPKIVDIDPKTLNIDPEQIERAIGPKTKAIMPVHVYGNPCDCHFLPWYEKYGTVIIADCCEALGATWQWPRTNAIDPVYEIGHIRTLSFYFSHHITTLEGGMVIATDPRHAEVMRMMRAHGWLRDTQTAWPATLLSEQDLHDGYLDPKFTFLTAGYNLRPTELAAAIGLEQMKKLDDFIVIRRRVALMLYQAVKRYDRWLSWQHETPGGMSSWFSFAIIVNKEAPFSARELRQHLEDAGIETRAIICGNIARQPAMRYYPHITVGSLPNADHVMKAGFSLGCHQEVTVSDCAYFEEVLQKFMGDQGLGDD